MSTITKEQLIEDLKASTQNSSGMFEIGEETICALMSLLTAPPAPVVPGAWEQWIADAVEYLEGGLEADGELEAEGSIEAKRLLSRHAAMLQGAEPVTTDTVQGIDMRDADRFEVERLQEIISGSRLVTTESKLLARFMLDAKQVLAAPQQEVKP